MEGRILEDKVVIVTGGAAGIGAALVRAILSQNARHVTFIDVAKREGEQLERELMNKFGTLKTMFINCDVSDESQYKAAFKKVVDKFHRLDIVINNAGILSADESLHKKMVDVNFTAVVYSTLMALDMMAADKGGFGGTIINVSSLLALKPCKYLPVYSATKAAVMQFTNSIATCYAGRTDTVLLTILARDFIHVEKVFRSILNINESNMKSQVRIVTVCLGATDTAILNKYNSDALEQSLTSRVPERQRVESAVKGIIDVIKKADNASTWVIAGNKPPADVTMNVREGLRITADENGI